MVPNPYDTRQRVKSMFGLAPTLGAQAGRGQAYREALAYITRAALMGGATGVSPGSGTVSHKWGICLTQVIALASAWWGGPPGPRRTPRPPAGRPARGPAAGCAQ